MKKLKDVHELIKFLLKVNLECTLKDLQAFRLF